MTLTGHNNSNLLSFFIGFRHGGHLDKWTMIATKRSIKKKNEKQQHEYSRVKLGLIQRLSASERSPRLFQP